MTMLVGRQAPNFTAPAVPGDGTLVETIFHWDVISKRRDAAPGGCPTVSRGPWRRVSGGPALGQNGMEDTPKGVADYLAENAEAL